MEAIIYYRNVILNSIYKFSAVSCYCDVADAVFYINNEKDSIISMSGPEGYRRYFHTYLHKRVTGLFYCDKSRKILLREEEQSNMFIVFDPICNVIETHVFIPNEFLS